MTARRTATHVRHHADLPAVRRQTDCHLSIASGSENKVAAIQKAADQSNVAVTMHLRFAETERSRPAAVDHDAARIRLDVGLMETPSTSSKTGQHPPR